MTMCFENIYLSNIYLYKSQILPLKIYGLELTIIYAFLSDFVS